MSTSGRILTSFVFLYLTSSSHCHSQGKNYWINRASKDLVQAIKHKINEGTAKNIILFIGDGMGVNTVTASRIYRAGEESLLSFESFPHVGVMKTYAVNKQVPDSASTATALFSGVKTNFETIGVTADVKYGDCQASLEPENRLDSFMVWAQDSGKATGIVTNTRITHATPAATYARSAARHWECDSKIPSNATRCKDIARQLVEDSPGKNFNVIMGGGLQCLSDKINVTESDPIDSGVGVRKDGRNLIKEWVIDKVRRGSSFKVVRDTSQIKNVDVLNTDYLIGIFSNKDMPYEYKRNKGNNGTPSLSLMTTTAVNILKKNSTGFVLMVEGGMIDQAHHLGIARIALDETVEFSNAINKTLKILKDSGILNETLVIVTSDHGHTLSINGYPEKGNSILGIASESKVDGIPWTTLTYGVGRKQNYQYWVTGSEPHVARQDPRELDTHSYSFRQLAAAPNDLSAHGGGDVIAYAQGPMAHLVHSVHEQNYIAHVMAYAAKIGPYAELHESSSSRTHCSSTLFIFNTAFFLIAVQYFNS